MLRRNPICDIDISPYISFPLNGKHAYKLFLVRTNEKSMGTFPFDERSMNWLPSFAYDYDAECGVFFCHNCFLDLLNQAYVLLSFRISVCFYNDFAASSASFKNFLAQCYNFTKYQLNGMQHACTDIAQLRCATIMKEKLILGLDKYND